MVIKDPETFKFLATVVFVGVLIVYICSVLLFKMNKVIFTYPAALKLVLALAAMIVFPLLCLSKLTVQEKMIGSFLALFAGVGQFFGTMYFLKIRTLTAQRATKQPQENR